MKQNLYDQESKENKKLNVENERKIEIKRGK